MIRIAISILSIASLLAGCSRQDDKGTSSSQPSATPSSPAPTNLPLKLTITNSPQASPLIKAKTQRAIEVKSTGILHIEFPSEWEDKLARIPGHGREFDSIMFRPHGGGDFELMVDVNNVGESNVTKVDIRDVLQKAGQVELTNAVEKSLETHDVQGPQATACYFVVTDKNYDPSHPRKGDYNYLTQGYAKLGALILSFRLVSNHLQPEQEQMLEMIKTARFDKNP